MRKREVILAAILCLFLWQGEVHAAKPLKHLRYWISEKLAKVHGYDALKKLKEANQTRPKIDKAVLRDEIKDRMSRVVEFKAIREMAEKQGVKIYLFGGTAAAWGHYVHWDLQREAGDETYQKDRFDYQYTSIFRASQDLDLVVDGPVDKIGALQAEINLKFPYFVGNKNAWELRPLREKLGDKEALLGNPDFLNQHTDSNSTGLIEITGSDGKTAIRDLLDFERGWDGIFFNDILESKLHYYSNPAHYRTSRYLAGMNPPIFSAIRYLTKAFQFELEILEEDWKQVQKVVAAFNPRKDLRNEYTRGWVERNGMKLYQHAMNIEYASDLISLIGLKKKLQDISDPKKVGTMGWFLNREPLRSRPLGKGSGKTAKELGLRFVAHDTHDLFVYESITKSKKGEANVLISTEHLPGDQAAHGWGFYTQIGSAGAWGTGITIRCELLPEAREGSDFLLISEGYAVIRNKNAIRVLPDGISVDLKTYFTEVLPSGGISRHRQIAGFDLLNRSVRSKMAVLTDDEFEALADANVDYLNTDGAKTAGLTELVKFLDTDRKIRIFWKLVDAYRARIKSGRNTNLISAVLVMLRYSHNDFSNDRLIVEFVKQELGQTNKYLGYVHSLFDSIPDGTSWTDVPGMGRAVDPDFWIGDHPLNIELFDAYNAATHYSDSALVGIMGRHAEYYAALPDAKTRALTLILKDRSRAGWHRAENAWIYMHAFSQPAWQNHPEYSEIAVAIVKSWMTMENADPRGYQSPNDLNQDMDKYIFKDLPERPRKELEKFLNGKKPGYLTIREAILAGREFKEQKDCSGFLKP